MQFKIKENSLFARIGAWKLGTTRIAMTIGDTIHLHNTSSQEFLQDNRWVKHELKHVEQYRTHGFIGFLWKYTMESIRRGYYNNRFEVEAREAESSTDFQR
ncbi:eCIS core domain-containing protein [Flavitalea antarctica]